MRNWKTWLKCASIRAVKTICQTAVGIIGTATVLGDVNWQMVISASILSGILSMLTSLAGLPEVDNNELLEEESEEEYVEEDYSDNVDNEDEVG